nr:hypothetical protein [Tanacetum cinerariifolium]
MTREAVNELIARQVEEAAKAHDAVKNLEPLVEGRGEHEDENGDDYRGGIGGGNGKGGRRFNNNPRDNCERKPAFKRQNVRNQNVARDYTADNYDRKG